MKIVFYNGDEVIDIVKDVNNPIVKNGSIYWDNGGSMTGINHKFMILDDDEDETVERILEEERKNKLYELSISCNHTILGKFSHTINETEYYFSNDMEAQANFEKAGRAFDKGLINEIMWTAYDAKGSVVRLIIDSTVFESLYASHLAHIQNNISKFRDTLMPQVQLASREQLINIKW